MGNDKDPQVSLDPQRAVRQEPDPGESRSDEALMYPSSLLDTHSGFSRDSESKSPSSTKMHQCPYCSTMFTRHHNLKSHLLTHIREKPYYCDVCDSRFRRLYDLKNHLKLHRGERPHTCPKCHRSFARGDALARHSRYAGACVGREKESEGALKSANSTSEPLSTADPAIQSDPMPQAPTFSTVNNLLTRFAGHGKKTEVENIYRDVLEWSEKALPAKHTSTSDSVNKPASSHQAQALYAAAEEDSKRVWKDTQSPSARISPCGSESNLSKTSSIASSAWSGSSISSASSYAGDALMAALDEITDIILRDEELHDLFEEAFIKQSPEKVSRNGVGLLKWLGRRLMVTAKKPVEKEAARIFLSQRHGQWVMHRIALKIGHNPSEKGRQGQIASDVESETSIGSDDSQQVTEGMPKQDIDAVKSFLESSDAFARLKEELGDFISPFRSEAMWKKTLWIGEQQVRFELRGTALQRTKVDKLKSALEEHLKLPILWWPLKQPRKSLRSDKVRMILPCVSRICCPYLKVLY